MVPYQSIATLVQSRSSGSLRSTPSGASLASLPSEHKWNQHVATTLRRNEKVRIQSEVTKLRDAFLREDPQHQGYIAKYRLKHCLKAGGIQLPDSELAKIAADFNHAGQFAWLRFCTSLEKGTLPSETFHPRPAPRPVTALEDGGASRGSVSSSFLAAKNSRRSLGTSSTASLIPANFEPKAPNRMRRMVSEASIASLSKVRAEADAKMSELTAWYSKSDASTRRSVTAAEPQRASTAYNPQENVADIMSAMSGAPPASPLPAPVAKPKRQTAEELAKIKATKEILTMAETGMNSRFSDMFKAFQFVDLDRSGRLSRDEIKRALDLWNVPVDEHKLDLLFQRCDADDDGGISYDEFVDNLARDSVTMAAMGKRGMQSKDAMGVSAYEAMDVQLGHAKQKKFVPIIN